MKKAKYPNLTPKALVCAIALGLTMVSGSVSANTGSGLAGSAGAAGATGSGASRTLIDLISPNLDTNIEKFQTVGDLEIYQAAKEAKVTMTMMLDLSGSMWWCLDDHPDGTPKDPDRDKTRYGIENYKLTDKTGKVVDKVTYDGKEIDVSKGFDVIHSYCDGGTKRNRLSELKHAVMTLFADGTKLPSDYKIGIGVFPIYGNYTARIMVPAKELTVEHRYRILRDVAGLNSAGGTPSVMAFAEAGAYMLGKTTTAFPLNAQKKTGFITKAILDGEQGVRGNAGLGYTIGRQCTAYYAPIYNGLINQFGGQVFNRFYTNVAQMMLHVGGIRRFTNYVPTEKTTVVRGSNNEWIMCGEVSDNAIGDVRFMDFSKYQFNENDAPIRVFGNSVKRTNGLNLNYMGYFTDAYHTGTDTHYKLENNTLPNINVNAPADVSKFSWVRDGAILLGEKVEYLEEVRNYRVGSTERVSHSGFNTSAMDTKVEALNAYESPLPDEIKTCDGAGVFFLTDGEPNSADNYTQIMARSLGYPERSDGEILARMAKDSGNKNNLTESFVYDAGVQQINGNANPKKGVKYTDSGWASLGAYAAILRNSEVTKKPAIKTATLGFGPVFDSESVNTRDVLDDRERLVRASICDEYSTFDAKNLCKLGEVGYGYGEGGFTAASEASKVESSIIRFAGSLQQDISNQPAGTISVPKDPLSVTNIQPYAYLPMLAPQVSKSPALWAGNLKKYHTLNGTLYGQDRQTRLYRKATTNPSPTTENKDYPSQFNSAVQDIWQENPKEDGSLITVGGTYGKIKDIKKSNGQNSRSVYVENYTNFQDGKPGTYADKELVKVAIENGQMVGFDKLKPPYNITDKVHLLNYLGVQIPTDIRMPTTEQALKDAFNAAKARRAFHDTLLGGVLHSVPVLATYRGEFQADGAISSDERVRQDHLLYGSMDGAVHLVDSDTGTENFAFIPRAMFEDTQQRHAMVGGATLPKVGSPKFGVDAPWVTYAEYVYDFGKKDKNGNATPEVRAKKMHAFGGLRMGGTGIYGLDITDRDKPTLNFALTRFNPNFDRMGQIWSKPTIAKIKTGPKPRDVRDVVIFGGGYDMCYEHPLFKLNDPNSVVSYDATHLHREQVMDNTTDDVDGTGRKTGKKTASCANKKQAMGNAVYMIDAKTGAFIASWKAGEGADDRRHMLHSVVGEIATLDSNNNGAIDHLYFADLGGQVFRVDLKEQATGNEMTRRVVRVFNANGGKTGDNHINYRFYDKPLISFYDHRGTSFAVVNVASGDRSSPVHTHRTATNANRIYGFFDRDLTTNKLDRKGALLDKMLTRDVNESNLIEINTKDVETGGKTKVTEIFGKLQSSILNKDASDKSVAQGWFYPMNRFDGRINVSGLKAVGLGAVMGNVYYANIYSPSYEYTVADQCSARVSGGTERQLYCLPWGICADESKGNEPTTANGVLGYLKAGPGIQELAIGTVTNTAGKSGTFRALLGQQTLSEVATDTGKRENRRPGGDQLSSLARLPDPSQPDAGAGSGADVYGPNVLVQPRYTLAVQRWYDLQNENQSN